MSFLNNKDTLEQYAGKVWLTRPAPFEGDGTQDINVCVETDGEFMAVGHLQLSPDGVYHNKSTRLGRRDDDAFRRYIEKLAGSPGESREAFLARVHRQYTEVGDMGAVARELGLSKGRVRRILITRGALESPLIAQIAWLYDEGRGKTVAEIAGMLKVSRHTVQSNLPYKKEP